MPLIGRFNCLAISIYKIEFDNGFPFYFEVIFPNEEFSAEW